ncbi:MAG: glycosyltransferase family 4 protein [Candidatus Omnitrophota bacterium]
MKVLNINRFYYRRGGADVYFFTMSNILESKGHSVITFSTKSENNLSSPYSKYFVDGYSEDTVSKLNFSKKARIFINGIYSREVKRNLRKLIKENKPDIAHIHDIFYQLSLSVIDVLKEERIPMVMALNGYSVLCANGYLFRKGRICELCKDNRHRFLLFNRCFKGAFLPSLMAYLVKKLQVRGKQLNYVDRFTVPHRDMKEFMSEWGIDDQKIDIISNPFNAAMYEPNYSFGDYIVAYGRVSRLKGIFTVLEAMKRQRTIKLKVFGSGPDYQKVANYIDKNKLDNIELDAKLRWGPDLIKIISKARFVISAPLWLSPSDYVISESFSLGKPVIASAIGGNNFLVKDGYNGFLFNPQDPVSLSEKIGLLYNDRNSIVEMGKNARKFVEEEFNYEKFYTNLMAIYKKALKPC